MFSPTPPECTLQTILKACLYLTLDFCEQPYRKINQKAAKILHPTPNITGRKSCCSLPPTISHRAVNMLDQYATDKRSNKPTSSGLVTFSWKSQPDPFSVSGREWNHGKNRTFVFGGLVQERRLVSQVLINGKHLPGNGSKLKKKKEWNPSEESI